MTFKDFLMLLAPDEPIQVECYAGYAGEETPCWVIIRGKRFPVEEVLERRREVNVDEFDWSDKFICRLEGCLVLLEKSPSGKWKISWLKY